MRLRVLLPDRVLLEEEVAKVVAETTAGLRGFLPRHIDFVAPLREGVLVVATERGDERFVAHDRGLLVKKGETVTVSTRRAVASDRLEGLRERVVRARLHETEQARSTRSALVQLETRLVKEFLELVR